MPEGMEPEADSAEAKALRTNLKKTSAVVGTKTRTRATDQFGLYAELATFSPISDEMSAHVKLYIEGLTVMSYVRPHGRKSASWLTRACDSLEDLGRRVSELLERVEGAMPGRELVMLAPPLVIEISAGSTPNHILAGVTFAETYGLDTKTLTRNDPHVERMRSVDWAAELAAVPSA